MGKTTREQLDSYKSKKAEINELQYKIAHLGEGDSMIGNDTIFDYRTGYPMPQAVIGADYEKISRLYTRYRKRIKVLKAECADVERWIEDISDSLTRRIFRMYFMDGMTQRAVAKQVHMDKSSVGRKIDNFLKVAPNAPNAPL